MWKVFPAGGHCPLGGAFPPQGRVQQPVDGASQRLGQGQQVGGFRQGLVQLPPGHRLPGYPQALGQLLLGEPLFFSQTLDFFACRHG